MDGCSCVLGAMTGDINWFVLFIHKMQSSVSEDLIPTLSDAPYCQRTSCNKVSPAESTLNNSQ